MWSCIVIKLAAIIVQKSSPSVGLHNHKVAAIVVQKSLPSVGLRSHKLAAIVVQKSLVSRPIVPFQETTKEEGT